MSKPTPMIRQYLELKEEHPGSLLFFRLGDFYELFMEDAEIGARVLDITLTARQKNTDNPIPMCGVPHHAAAGYIAKLVKNGYKVAICEQTEEAVGQKLVKREVVRVITPGTAIDEQLLEPDEPVFLASVFGTGGSYGLAYLDLSTAEFKALEFEGADAWSSMISDLETIAPKEVLFPTSLKPLIESEFGQTRESQNDLFEQETTSRSLSALTTQLADSTYDSDLAARLLNEQFQTKDLTGFEIENSRLAIAAAGACLSYAKKTQRDAVEHINGIDYLQRNDFLVLDAVTISNLEVVKGADGSAKRSLYAVINETLTAMGSRTLRSWLLRPSVKLSEIEARQKAIEVLLDGMLRDQVRFHLKNVSDVERLIGRVNLGKANPRDLKSLSQSVEEFPNIYALIGESDSGLLRFVADSLKGLETLADYIDSAIIDEPPVKTEDGGFIRDGYEPELDKVRDVASNAKQIIATFEQSERESTGINALHVKFNNVFGYFIEVSKSNLSKVPEHYERRQTLTNSERFTTPELKQWESEVLGAEDKIKNLEANLFKEIISTVGAKTHQLQKAARALGVLDTIAGLALVAIQKEYIRPKLHKSDELRIKNGRHPVVESLLPEPFVPNDLAMNNSTDRMLVITGANMGGKSTILRQTAIIQLMAQLGSFVPASEASLPLVDRIWTRVGASDDLSSGRSTFMVEMTETAKILHNATPRSLVLLDEIGRGTSTFDGLSIAWAVAEYLHDSPQHSAKTLFATHYHELTELAEKLPGAKNYQVTAKEVDGKVVFLHRLEPGTASKSYGIAVAKLAGLPQESIERAKQVLKTLEKYELAVFETESLEKPEAVSVAATSATRRQAAAQVSLFALSNEDVLDEIRDLDIENMDADKALVVLKEIKNKIN